MVVRFVPTVGVSAVYVLAAVLPAAYLLRYIYRHDTVEKEPPGLLASLLFLGVVAAVLSGVLEALAESVLRVFVDPESPAYAVALAFLVVAVIEEGTKFCLMKRRTWRDPNFNYRFDGIVYAVFVSLGFAAFENIQYVVRFGLATALARALLAIPGHMSFAVLMGVFYGRARLYENVGDSRSSRRARQCGYLAAVSLHGFYDACLMVGSNLSTLAFLVFVVVLFWAVFRLVRRESALDGPI